MAKAPLIFTYYSAAPVEKVWDGFVSKEANQKIFAAQTPGEPLALAGSEDSTCRGFEHAQLTQRKRRCELFLRQSRFSWC